MPRKQNGFGNSQSFAFKGAGRVDKGKGVGSFGYYPRDRQFGSSVHRTVIENWNLNSNWTKWRRGYELYSKAAFSLFRVANDDYNPAFPVDETNEPYIPAVLKSLLYQGTPYEIETLFTAIEMPTLKSDVNTHYVVKRYIEKNADLAVITGRSTDNLEEQRAYNEAWFKGAGILPRARLLLQMVNERLTDDETEASLKNVLTKSNNFDADLPAIYKGKTPTALGLEITELKPTTVLLRVPLANILLEENVEETVVVNQNLSTYTVTPSALDGLNNLNELIGKIVYIQDFFVDKNINDVVSAEWSDYSNYFGLNIINKESNKEIIVLDPGVSALPPSMYDIASLPRLFSATDAGYTIEGGYAFLKNDYQRYYGRRYLTDELVRNEVDSFSYSVFPFTILGVAIKEDYLEIKSVPFTSEIKLYAPIDDPTLVFGDQSFTKYTTPRSSRFTKAINTNVNVWQDEVFTSGNPIKPAEMYSCDCASYSKAIIAMPQSTQNKAERTINRQNRYPLPTALSPNRFENLGIDKVAGKAASWASASDKNAFRYCKHTVTGMFVDGVQLIEPSQYPTTEEREYFEGKLEAELLKLDDAWRYSAERGGISLTEIVFSLSQGLNLDDVETGYVVLNSQ